MLSPPLRVAIADDDRSIRELLQQILRNLGHEVVAVAENGQSLVQQSAITEPDVIVTDNVMPDISGVDAAAIIYKRRPTRIILLSANCDRELVLDAEQKHVMVYLVKPVSQANLEAALGRCQELRNLPRGSAGDEDSDFDDESHRPLTIAVYRSDISSPYPQVRRPR
jgi:CheY-like chemotaxis protein